MRGPLIAELFRLYATGDYSIKALLVKGHAVGLTHPRSGRPLFKSELHRLLHNPVYHGEFLWDGKRYPGSHQPLITRETFDDVQAVLRRKPRAHYPKQQHAFMGLLTCARCGCAMTAEKKKGKYVYYRCTGSKGACGNTYVRQEQLADLLGHVVQRIDLRAEVADQIADSLRGTQREAERSRKQALEALAQRHRIVQTKLDRGYEDYLEGKISETFWTRKSDEWETELGTVETEMGRLSRPAPDYAVTGQKILELVKQAEFLYKSQNPAEQRRLLETVLSNCTFDRGTLCPTYSKPFDLLVRGNETGDWLLRLDSNQQPSG